MKNKNKKPTYYSIRNNYTSNNIQIVKITKKYKTRIKNIFYNKWVKVGVLGSKH
jgi:hypothetical protein